MQPEHPPAPPPDHWQLSPAARPELTPPTAAPGAAGADTCAPSPGSPLGHIRIWKLGCALQCWAGRGGTQAGPDLSSELWAGIPTHKPWALNQVPRDKNRRTFSSLRLEKWEGGEGKEAFRLSRRQTKLLPLTLRNSYLPSCPHRQAVPISAEFAEVTKRLGQSLK